MNATDSCELSRLISDKRTGFETECTCKDPKHRLHARAFQSKRFHDLETASKTTRFQGVYTEPIQPLNPTVYVEAISFSGLCASSIGARFDQTRIRRLSSPRPNPESSLPFLFVTLLGVSTKKSTFQDICACISEVWLSVYSKIQESCKSEVKPQIKVVIMQQSAALRRDLPYLLREPANFAPDRF